MFGMFHNDQLQVAAVFSFSGNYGEVTKTKRLKTIRDLLSKKRNYKPHIISRFDNKFIPLIDADSEEDMIRACNALNEINTGYGVIKSSEYHHYWIFPAFVGTYKDAILIMNMIPGNDTECTRACQECKTILIRGYNKNQPPEIIQKSGHPVVDRFLDKLDTYFNSNVIKWYSRNMVSKDTKLEALREINSQLNLEEIINSKLPV